MPIYRVQGPDGKILRIEGPEGASAADLEAAAAQHYAPKGSGPAFNPRALYETVNATPDYIRDALRSFGTGGADLAVGSGQLISHIVPEAIGGPIGRTVDYLTGGTGEGNQSFADRYASGMRTREEAYQGGRSNPETADVGRFTGNVVASGLLGGGGSAAPAMAGRMVQGAKMGGALGLAQPIDPETSDYFGRKAVQVGASAVVGAAAPPVVEAVIKGTGAVVNALARGFQGLKSTISGQASTATIEQALSKEMNAQGLPWSQLPQDFRAKLVDEAQKAIKGGGKLDPEAVRRLADFQRFKMEPTQGQLSRDPVQFGREVNLSNSGEVGRPLAERFGAQNARLVEVLDEARGATGAPAGDAYSAGQSVISGLKATDAARKSGVDVAYQQFRESAGMDTSVPAQRVAQKVGQIIEDFGEDRIPSAVAKRLSDFGFMGGKQTKDLTIREAEKLKTLIGNNIDNPQSPTGKALTLLSRSIDEAVSSVGESAGAQTATLAKGARGLASERFGILEGSPGMAKAVSGDAVPDKFIEQTFLRGSVDEVSNTLRQLRPQQLAEVRAATLDWLKSKSVTGVEDTAKFSQAALGRAMESIGRRKLELILGKEGLAELDALRRVGAYVQAPPTSAGINTSNSANTLVDLMDRAGRLPLLGAVVGKPGDMARSAQVAEALRGSPVKPGGAVVPAGEIDEASRLASAFSSSESAPAVNELMDNRARRLARALAGKR